MFDNQVSLYLHNETDTDDLPQEWQRFVSPGEYQRAEKMGSPERAHTFLRTRALLRRKLADILGVEPASVPLEITPEGKVFLADAKVPTVFSLSHSNGLILIGLSTSAKNVGVDVEYLDPATDMEKIGRRFFTAEERRKMDAADPGERRDLAFQIWCLKEARFKAGINLDVSVREETGLLKEGFAYAACYG